MRANNALSEMVRVEGQSISKLEKAYMKKERQNIYVALEDIDFVWSDKEIQKFIMMWDSGFSVKEISKKLKRPIDDVTMLIYDQALKSKIKPREKGLMGNET